MATNEKDKFVKSKKSFLEIGKLLECESCKKLANNPHILGCDHTFCLPCTDILSGKPCPVCNVVLTREACRKDHIIENLIEAYLPMAKFLGIDVTRTHPIEVDSTKSGNNAVEKTPLALPTPVNKNSSKKTVKTANKTEQFSSPCNQSLIKKRERKESLNESLDCSINATSSASKINKRNKKGETPLHVACVKQDFQRVKELLIIGANPNTQDNAGWTPLHEVVGCGNESIVGLLLDYNANPNIPGGQNETPLHDAVASNRVTIARFLVLHGADVSARNSRGLTPKDLCPSEDEAMKAALESVSGVAPVTPCTSERLRQTLQAVQLFVINPEKKSQPKLNKLARTLGFKLVATYSNQVTHVAVRLDDPSLAIKANPHFYSSVLQGQFIVDFKWIEESEKLERLTDPNQHEIDGTLNRAPTEGAQNRLNAALQLPGLFNNCFFYLNGIFSTPSKVDITQWIKHGGGNILTRNPNPENIICEKIPYHASPAGPLAKCSHFILYDLKAKTQPSIKYNMSHVKTLSIDWLIACIERFALVDPF